MGPAVRSFTLVPKGLFLNLAGDEGCEGSCWGVTLPSPWAPAVAGGEPCPAAAALAALAPWPFSALGVTSPLSCADRVRSEPVGESTASSTAIPEEGTVPSRIRVKTKRIGGYKVNIGYNTTLNTTDSGTKELRKIMDPRLRGFAHSQRRGHATWSKKYGITDMSCKMVFSSPLTDRLHHHGRHRGRRGWSPRHGRNRPRMLLVVVLLRPERNHRRRRLGRREAAGRTSGVAGPDHAGAAPEPGTPKPRMVAGRRAPKIGMDCFSQSQS